MKVILLNDGGFRGMKGVDFPVEVEAHPPVPTSLMEAFGATPENPGLDGVDIFIKDLIAVGYDSKCAGADVSSNDPEHPDSLFFSFRTKECERVG